MIISIASGKGGTGKTTVALSLASVLSKRDEGVTLLDCDVEAPNAHLFLPAKPKKIRDVMKLVPKVDPQKCDASGMCGKVCEFGAIILLGKKVLVFPELCHSCNACLRFCPSQALSESPHPIGTLEEIEQVDFRLVFGRLNVGVPSAVPLIQAVREHINMNGTTLIDGPPGASCSLLEALRDVDFALLVTEPTPFGLHDLKKAVSIVRTNPRPFGVVVNRMGIGDERVQQYCRSENIPILMEIPHSLSIAKAYSSAKILTDACPEYVEKFERLFDRIQLMVHEESEKIA